MEKVEESLVSRTTRRRVIKTGAKIAYAVPVVAASFAIPGGALAKQGDSNGNGNGNGQGSINQCGVNECICDSTFSFHPLVGTKCCVSCNEGATGASTCGGSDNVSTGCPGGHQPFFAGQFSDPSTCTGAIVCAKAGTVNPNCRPVYTGSPTSCGGGNVATF